MALTLAIFAAVQVVMPLWIRPHLLPADQTTAAIASTHPTVSHLTGALVVTVSSLPGQPGAWILSSGPVDAAGRLVSTLPAACTQTAGSGPPASGLTAGSPSDVLPCKDLLIFERTVASPHRLELIAPLGGTLVRALADDRHPKVTSGAGGGLASAVHRSQGSSVALLERLVLANFASPRGLTRGELEELTGLSRTVAAGVVASLVAQGELAETRQPLAQLYLTDPAAAGEPAYQLKGFQKITLTPGQSRRITFQVTTQDMSYYQTATSNWAAAPGIYRVSIGSNERDLPVSAPFYSH
jgi:hypothetical protein